MGIERRIEKASADQINPDTTDGRACLHNLVSTVPDLRKVRHWIDDSAVEPLNPELTKKLSRVEMRLADLARAGGRNIITLPPVSPRGLVSSLTKTDPRKISHGSGRPVDVVPDPALDLAAEAYRQRKRGNQKIISLGCNQRCLRLQRYRNSDYKPHFSMFTTLDSTNSYIPGRNFSIDIITSLAVFYSHALRDLGVREPLEISIGHVGIMIKYRELVESVTVTMDLGLSTERRGLNKIDFSELHKNLAQLGVKKELRQLERLAVLLNKADLADDVIISLQLLRPSGAGHYNGLAFYILMPDGNDIVDGGSVGWLARLTSNHREYTVVSGIGTQLLADKYL